MTKLPGPERSGYRRSRLGNSDRWVQTSSYSHDNKPQIISLEPVDAIIHLISPGYESRLVLQEIERRITSLSQKSTIAPTDSY